jgi:hypothetical protein
MRSDGGKMLGKKPLDYIMRQFYDAMELLVEYDRDQSFMPNADQLVLLEKLEKQLMDQLPASYMIIHQLRDRAKGMA